MQITQEQQQPQDRLLHLMAETESICRETGAPLQDYAAKTKNLAARLQEKQFHLAVLGQFKRGKSTLINALLGAELLPTSSVPVTALPTVIRQAKVRQATIVFANGQMDTQRFVDDLTLLTFITRYVAERENPQNRYGVSRVEIEYPSSFLDGGVILIDTPGIGSTLKHNTEATLHYLDQCDAALFVVSADPPITASEVDFLHTVTGHVKKLFFVLNKVDYLSSSDRDEVLAFIRGVLQDEMGMTEPETLIYGLSARQALAAKQTGDGQQLTLSRFGALETDLAEFFGNEKSAVLVAAITTKFAAVLREASMDLDLLVRALEMPTTELEKKIALLEHKLAEIEKQRLIASDLLAGEKQRTLALLEHQAMTIRQSASTHLWSIVTDLLADSYRPGLEEKAHAAIAQAILVFFGRELDDTASAFGGYIDAVLEPHWRQADELVAAVRQQASQVFDIDYKALDNAEVFQMKRLPYWVKDEWRTGYGEIPQAWLDKLLPVSIRLARVRKRLERHVDSLITRNVENLRWATLQNVETSFRAFDENLRTRLAAAVANTKQAIAAAMVMKTGKADEVGVALERLEACAQKMCTLEARLDVLGTWIDLSGASK